MFYVAKILQACGMGIVLIDFLRKFPNLMSRQVLMIGLLIFAAWWITEKFLLKR